METLGGGTAEQENVPSFVERHDSLQRQPWDVPSEGDSPISIQNLRL